MSVEHKIKTQLGELLVTIYSLQDQVEAKDSEIADLKAKLDKHELTKKTPK